METKKEKYVVFYSSEADEFSGHNTVKLISGERVKYTAMMKESDNYDSSYGWPDKIFLGECIKNSIVYFTKKPLVNRFCKEKKIIRV